VYPQSSRGTLSLPILAALAAALAAALVVSVAAAQVRTLDRDLDPVVLAGSDLPDLAGLPPGEIVAFRWTGAWEQVPVQVDERAVLDYGLVYGEAAVGLTVLQYTDPLTWSGPDPDPTLDGDDELVFMARDTGDRADCPAAGEPPGVLAGSGVEIEARDRLTGDRGWLYLFLDETGLDPGAGRSTVDYDFHLLSGDYLLTYDTSSGPNPEDSVVSTPYYSAHFSDRWIRDELRITAGSSTGVDILDRHRNLFGPGMCGRSEDTFSAGEGAFFANISGPVRAVRAYVGANSGPLTSRTHWFYEARHDVLTDLRVHAIPGMLDIYDLSVDGVGMTWYDSLNQGGVAVDGVPDAVIPGPVEWWLVTGAQGSLLSSGRLDTDIPGLAGNSYYNDDVDPGENPCTGDDSEYAASGGWIDGGVPNTDPALGPPVYIFQGWRIDTVAGPGATTAWAAARHQESQAAVTATAQPWCLVTCDAGRILPLRELRLERLGEDLLLEWEPDDWADSYNVWRVWDVADIPDLREGGGAAAPAGCHPTSDALCADTGAAALGGERLLYYQARGACAGTEAAE